MNRKSTKCASPSCLYIKIQRAPGFRLVWFKFREDALSVRGLRPDGYGRRVVADRHPPLRPDERPIPFHFAYSNVSGFTAASQTATKTLFFSVSSPTSFIMNGNSPCSSARHRQWILPPSYPTVRASPFELLAFMHIVYHITHNKTRKIPPPPLKEKSHFLLAQTAEILLHSAPWTS